MCRSSYHSTVLSRDRPLDILSIMKTKIVLVCLFKSAFAYAGAIPFDVPCAAVAAKAAMANEARSIVNQLPQNQIDTGVEFKVTVPTPEKVELRSTVTNSAGNKDYVFSVRLNGTSVQPTYTVVVRENDAKCSVLGVDLDKK